MAGRVSDPSGNCCIMGDGDFAVVPSALVDGDDAFIFLPSCSVSASSPSISLHPLSDALSLIADSSGWADECSCHEVEPLLVDCLNSGSDSIHAALFADRLYIAVLKGNSLAFVNRFASHCNEDYLYHLLNTCRATGLNPLHHPLFVRGDINKSFLNNYFARCV